MNNIQPTYSSYEIVDLLFELSSDKEAIKIISGIVTEEEKRYCLYDLWWLQLLINALKWKQ